MPSWSSIADNIMSALGYTHDDAARSKEAILYNTGLAASNLIRQRVEKEIRVVGDRGTTGNLTVYPDVPIQASDELNGRLFIQLPGELMDLKYNGGVSYIAYNRKSGCADNLMGVQFTMASPSEVRVLNNITFQKPTPTTPYYWTNNMSMNGGTPQQYLWMIGPSALLKSVEIGLYMIPSILDPLADPDAESNIPADLLYHVERLVLGMERFSLLLPLERLKNDGRDFKVNEQRIQPPQVVSVNDPGNITNV